MAEMSSVCQFDFSYEKVSSAFFLNEFGIGVAMDSVVKVVCIRFSHSIDVVVGSHERELDRLVLNDVLYLSGEIFIFELCQDV